MWAQHVRASFRTGHLLGWHHYAQLIFPAGGCCSCLRRVAGRRAPRHAAGVVEEPFTVENGMLGNTLKLRRHEVARQHAALIDAVLAAKLCNGA